jgi:hypothetical protein
METTTDTEVTAHSQQRPPDTMATPPVVAVGALSDQHACLWLRIDTPDPFPVEVKGSSSRARFQVAEKEIRDALYSQTLGYHRR